jgi:hypothetical protein
LSFVTDHSLSYYAIASNCGLNFSFNKKSFVDHDHDPCGSLKRSAEVIGIGATFSFFYVIGSYIKREMFRP